eukprot:TRINITY_DN2698_c0_g1_i4.p1 TRINITY_DN2698_c0_g1~~TRINITY_DN2698_c0_g1_i4.p1  ORF type:complete len:433 (-),score=103.26 TRINITY_DN2698_c0_g1_i4:147-1445(-)
MSEREKDDDILKQHNKGHRGLREKLKKKRKRKDEIKKAKKEKKKQKDLEKGKKKKHEKKKKERDEHGVKHKKLKKVLKKFLGYFQDDIEEFYSIFATLDNGDDIDISGLEDLATQKFLKKIFKYLGTAAEPKTSIYKKNMEEQPFSYQAKVRKMVNDIEAPSESSESDEGSDQDDDKEDDDEPELKKKAKKSVQFSIPPEEEEKLRQKEVVPVVTVADRPIELVPDEQKGETANIGEPKKKLYGPAFAPMLLAQTDMVKPATQDAGLEEAGERKSNTKELDSFLESTFGKVETNKHKQSLKEMFAKREPGSNKAADAQPGMPKYDEEELEQIRQFNEEYNKKYRPRSLMEEHRERLAEKKKNKGKGTEERRPFDREVDLAIQRVDSKRVFQMINNSDNSLSKRFSGGNFQGSFLQICIFLFALIDSAMGIFL